MLFACCTLQRKKVRANTLQTSWQMVLEGANWEIPDDDELATSATISIKDSISPKQ